MLFLTLQDFSTGAACGSQAHADADAVSPGTRLRA